ncbi:MAG: hypothetical protein IJ167_09410, partial [Lachnospiraceae bacterium]|nr:hypothetical protein [Lachnospiraceae bacterium]
MKGIRKLFFGLFLMTLIGVGFKVDAKAAASTPPVMNLSIINSATGEGTSWSDPNAELVGSVTIQEGNFPQITSVYSGSEESATSKYECKFEDTSDSTKTIGSSVDVFLKTVRTTVDDAPVVRYYVSIGDELNFTPLSETPYKVLSVSRDNVKTAISTNIIGTSALKSETVKFTGKLALIDSTSYIKKSPSSIATEDVVDATASSPETINIYRVEGGIGK